MHSAHNRKVYLVCISAHHAAHPTLVHTLFFLDYFKYISWMDILMLLFKLASWCEL